MGEMIEGEFAYTCGKKKTAHVSCRQLWSGNYSTLQLWHFVTVTLCNFGTLQLWQICTLQLWHFTNFSLCNFGSLAIFNLHFAPCTYALCNLGTCVTLGVFSCGATLYPPLCDVCLCVCLSPVLCVPCLEPLLRLG